MKNVLLLVAIVMTLITTFLTILLANDAFGQSSELPQISYLGECSSVGQTFTRSVGSDALIIKQVAGGFHFDLSTEISYSCGRSGPVERVWECTGECSAPPSARDGFLPIFGPMGPGMCMETIILDLDQKPDDELFISRSSAITTPVGGLILGSEIPTHEEAMIIEYEFCDFPDFDEYGIWAGDSVGFWQIITRTIHLTPTYTPTLTPTLDCSGENGTPPADCGTATVVPTVPMETVTMTPTLTTAPTVPTVAPTVPIETVTMTPTSTLVPTVPMETVTNTATSTPLPTIPVETATNTPTALIVPTLPMDTLTLTPTPTPDCTDTSGTRPPSCPPPSGQEGTPTPTPTQTPMPTVEPTVALPDVPDEVCGTVNVNITTLDVTQSISDASCYTSPELIFSGDEKSQFVGWAVSPELEFNQSVFTQDGVTIYQMCITQLPATVCSVDVGTSREISLSLPEVEEPEEEELELEDYRLYMPLVQ
ncbi:MAG: hypothetical protein AAF702_31460 [Chloroflexota bacterium]